MPRSTFFGEMRGQNNASSCAELACYLTYGAAIACVYQLGAAKDDWSEGKYVGAMFRIAGFAIGSIATVTTMATKAYDPIVDAVSSFQESTGTSHGTSRAVGHLTAVSTTIGATLIVGNTLGYTASKLGDGFQTGVSRCVSALFCRKNNVSAVVMEATQMNNELSATPYSPV